MSSVQFIPKGARGFDCNRPLKAVEAKKMFDLGYRFAVRYVARVSPKANDLTKDEVDHLHSAGLAVMPVQHVESESSWIPSLEKGKEYGRGAVNHCRSVGIPSKTCVWLDLEGVSIDFLPNIEDRKAAIVGYCNAWFDEVAAAGFTPGIYVGWHAGLTAVELFQRLKFRHYWAAYNLNADQQPAKRGVQMRQGAAKKGDVPADVDLAIDTNLVTGDQFGDFPLAWAPDEWALAGFQP